MSKASAQRPLRHFLYNGFELPVTKSMALVTVSFLIMFMGEFMHYFLLFFIVLFSLLGTAQAEQVEISNPAIPVEILEESPDAPFFILKPNTTLHSTLFGVCKHVTNLTNNVNAFIPTAENTWPDFDSRKDQNGTLIIEVKSCKE